MARISRENYLQGIINEKDKKIIKIISGVRRSGKSTLLELFQKHLLESGVDKSQIISINFEDVDFEDLKNYKKLHTYIKERMLPDKMNYIFLDEIQHVDGYEKAVDSLYIKENVDLYLTGSNAYFLSSDLATLLTGRFLELKILPLSFKEFCQGDYSNLDEKFADYIKRSSFPYNIAVGNNEAQSKKYLEDLYASILYRDVVKRLKVSDAISLENLADFMFHNIGNLLNPTNIANTLTSAGKKIDVKTVDKYMKGLTDSMLFYRVNRFNIKGKQFLSANPKYYAVDMAMRNMRVGGRDTDAGHLLENIVYLELQRRYKHVFVGEVEDGKVDFVVKDGDEYLYFQVTDTMLNEKTAVREVTPLKKIADNYPKTILTSDSIFAEGNIEGIKKVNVLKWLCD